MQAPFHIVILGGGTAGWMAANLMLHKWSGDKVRLTLVESPDVGIIGVGEGSTPTLKRFFQMLDIAEHEWMPQCNATYKVNIRFNDWSPGSGVDSYCHPFTSQTDTFTQRAFQVNCRTRRLGLDTRTQPEDFLINGVLAGQGKGPQTGPNFPFQMEYGYHFDSHLLGEFLKQRAVQNGAQLIQQHIEHVTRHANQDIAALVTKQGQQISGDLFIDCSGFASVLMQKTLGVKFNSYADNLFNNAAVVMPTPALDQIPSETNATALSHGWCWHIPLTNRVGNGYVYSRDFISPEQAERELRQHLGTLDDQQPARHLTMKVGQLQTHWQQNCVGLGLAQGFIEPLEATALHLVQICVEMLIDHLDRGNFTDKHKAEFNQRVSHRFERVRDYIVAHYKLNTRNDSEYWRANRNNKNLSDSLTQILDVWFQRGDLIAEIERQDLHSHFDSVSWHCLLAGYGAFPPLAPNQPGKGDLYIEQQLQKFVEGCAMNFSSHQTNLKALAG